MRLESVTAEIRPRSDWEAVDLGLALARRDFWRLFCVWWLALVVPLLLAGWWLWERPLLLFLLFWWFKPAASRVVLFELGRRLFGERPRWRDTLRQIPKAWTRRFFHRFLLGRLSPWLPVTLAVEELEGLRGKAHKQRRKQLARRGEGAVTWIYLIADLAACWFGLAILMLAAMFIPQGQDGAWQTALDSWDPTRPAEIPLLILRVVLGCVMLATSLVDVFATAAGFGIYLNNRTWLEGWDVELALKRMAKRISGVAGMICMGFLLCQALPLAAQEARDPTQVIREVKSDGAFKVHTIIERVPKEREKRKGWTFPSLGVAPWLGELLIWLAAAALVGMLVWLLWKHRASLVIRRLGDGAGKIKRPVVRMVMGMEVAPETLPADVAAAVRGHWRDGRHREALGLLYRAAISRLLENGAVDIRESDTEGDCLRRVEHAGETAHPGYFRGVATAWARLAYAGELPGDAEIEDLCRQWPFDERNERRRP